MKIQRIGLVAGLTALVLGGCSRISVPLGSADVDTPLVLTGALPSSADVASADIETSDRLAISETLASLLPDADDVPPLAMAEAPGAHSYSWTNPETGNSGSISGIDRVLLDETGCIGFRTTANTIAGIRLYAGTACRDGRQKLIITSLTVEAA